MQFLLQKKFHNAILKYINWPIIFSGTGLIPPATPLNYVSWAIVGFIFNYVIRRRHFSWWTKYNCEYLVPVLPSLPHLLPKFRLLHYVSVTNGHALRTTDILSAGLDSGVAISVILIFFALQYPKNGTIG